MVSHWFSGLRGGLILGLIALGVVVAVASAKQVSTGHAEIQGHHGSLGDGDRGPIFKHKNMAEVDLVCQGNNHFIGLDVRNLEKRPIVVTSGQTFQLSFRFASKVDPGDSKRIVFSDPDIGITDLSHKYATLNIDWGLLEKRCVYSAHTIVHFSDGTPLNADHVPGSARK